MDLTKTQNKIINIIYKKCIKENVRYIIVLKRNDWYGWKNDNPDKNNLFIYFNDLNISRSLFTVCVNFGNIKIQKHFKSLSVLTNIVNTKIAKLENIQ